MSNEHRLEGAFQFSGKIETLNRWWQWNHWKAAFIRALASDSEPLKQKFQGNHQGQCFSDSNESNSPKKWNTPPPHAFLELQKGL